MKPQQSSPTVRTRFAPSPTGMLHIGGARTALYNYLYAKHMGGEYLLRIEDTDIARSTPEAVQAILDGLKWLNITHDGAIVYQSKRRQQHIEVAQKLLNLGKAYKCYCTTDELDAMREAQKAAGQKTMYNQKCLHTPPADTAKPYTIRLKTPEEGSTSWDDAVQGKINYPNKEVDDFILLRSDGTPTYNLVVIVDDVDMQITHVIRGDDHINNTPKQLMIYQALGLTPPTFAHISLIHGDDGKKLSKRHGAVAVTNFQEEGFLADAVNNYLLQIGWSSKKDILSREEAIATFDITHINKGASNFNTQKLEWLNSQYLMAMDGQSLLHAVTPFLNQDELTPALAQRLRRGLPGLAKRAKRLTELAEKAAAYLTPLPLTYQSDAAEALAEPAAKECLSRLHAALSNAPLWQEAPLEDLIKTFTQTHGYKMPQVGKPLRAALLGTTQAPALGDILFTLGKQETLARLEVIT